MGIFRKDKHKDRHDSNSPEPHHAPSDSTYHNDNSTYGSNISSADTRVQQPAGTTITTVTTTTTTTTTVNPDGSTHVHSHPYNPHTDPPPASETLTSIPASNVPSSNRTSNSDSFVQPPQSYTPDPQAQCAGQDRRSSTSGGRPIPERTPMPERTPGTTPTPDYYSAASRNSLLNPNEPAIAPTLANKPNQTTKLPALNTYQPPNPPYAHELHGQSHSPVSPARSHTPNFSRPGPAAPSVPPPAVPVSPTTPDHTYKDEFLHTQSNTQNTSRLNSTQTNGVHVTKRSNLASAARGLHGASEAFRGAVNERIATVSGDEVERDRMRHIKQAGMRELEDSGLREKAGERVRLRRRSGQILGHGHQGMETVEERTIN